MRGSATITVSSKVAKALGLKSTTLATGTVSSRAPVASRSSSSVSGRQGALAKAKGSVKVTLCVSLQAKGESAKKSTRTITLARK